jgi:hypothetical protein
MVGGGRGGVVTSIARNSITASGALWSSGERTEFERELRESSDEIARLNSEIMHSVNGGDSWCMLFLYPPENEAGKGEVYISHMGKYPLYDLRINIIDIQKMVERLKEVKTGTRSSVQDRSWFNVGNLTPNSNGPLGLSWDLPTTDRRDFTFHFYARNGRWGQSYKFRRVNGRLALAIRVERSDGEDNSERLYEQVDDDFPRDEHGEVEWNST